MRAADILAAVSQEAGVDMADLLGPDRRNRYSWPRQLAMLMIRERCGMSLHQVKRETRRQDHTTIIHGCRAAEGRLRCFPAYRALHDRVVARLAMRKAA